MLLRSSRSSSASVSALLYGKRRGDDALLGVLSGVCCLFVLSDSDFSFGLPRDLILRFYGRCQRLCLYILSSSRCATSARSLPDHVHGVPVLARPYTSGVPLPKEESTDATNSQGFKGHDMLAPFTAGWQSTDLHPLVIEKSEGSYVYDINGKKYLDSLAGLWCTALGGNEPRLIDAAVKQLNTLPFYHSFWNRTTKPSLDLAKELLDTFTATKMAKAFFTNSGSEANDTQVKLVWYYNNALGRPEKKKFIARANSYHGSTLISASLSGLPPLHQKFDLPAPFVLHTDCPHYWRYHLPGETEEEFSTRLAKNLENLILKEGPETIAAFIAEPVMGAGGVIPPPATYFEKIQAVMKKYDILFIADEVLFLSFTSHALCLSLFSCHRTFSHGFTYSGHPVSCAVALEAIKIYRERNILDQVNSIAPKFQEGLKAYSDSPIIGEIRGTGLILGIGAYFGAQCEKHGMLVRVAGDKIMMSPPFIMTHEDIDELISIYGKALKATEERVKELKSKAK
ncbi:hypothetical protein CDL15_Pgr011760 [Punica granatum]|uniref:Uncharacterized protein n=1 Tax=Punica granatum TaxID=22663 RepID=A0A218XE44_PUNGR|nr:hypothetical protein CDL15_Pgr011760 [Punica granatum]